jgi:DNA-binding NarL/FixJ family response regulator
MSTHYAPSQLTPTQLRVAQLLARGRTDKQIAAVLGVTPRRVAQVIDRLAEVWGLDRHGDVRIQIAVRAAA